MSVIGTSIVRIKLLSKELFVSAVADVARRAPEELGFGESLESLGFDSLTMVELRLVLEGLGSPTTIEIAPSTTVDELYRQYSRVQVDDAVQGAQRLSRPVATDLAPSLEGRVVRIRPVGADDLPAQFAIATNQLQGCRWRYRGSIPSYDSFVADFSANVLTQFSVCDRSGRVVGLVVAYGADLRNGFANIGAVVAPPLVGTGAGAEALLLLIRHLFATWNFRKLYAETTDMSLVSVRSALDDLFVIEGTMKDRYFYGGRFWDAQILVLDRERWEKVRTGPLGLL